MKSRNLVVQMLMVVTLLTLWCLPSFAAPLPVPTGPKNADGTWAIPDYNTTANWAFSPPLAKFVDTLPGITSAGANNLGQYVPLAKPDTITYPGSDYYEIDLVEYSERMHSDLPASGTRLRGYVQTNSGTDASGANTLANDPPHYLGPAIVAQRDRPVRIKFTNRLPVGQGGDLFIPVDETVMGAGKGPLSTPTGNCANPQIPHDPIACGFYTQNRATLHLHGGRTPWISDGTPHQWTTPVGEITPYKQGVSVQNVPDMPDPGPGALNFYYSNQQSARLMFYHDHAFGITRLNVMVGEAAGYLIMDKYEKELVDNKIIPADIIPLVIQDKTFVDAATIRTTDPLWNWGTGVVTNGVREPVTGDLWMPHVYMPAQNPYNKDLSGNNPFGRWMYGPWFYPPTIITNPPMPNPYYDVNCDSLVPAELALCTPGSIGQPPVIPATPHPSMGMEAFLDTAMVNGTAFPRMEVEPRAYRFRILNAANDRGLNLSIYKADTTQASPDNRTASPYTEVKMVPAAKTAGWPTLWPTDGRLGGVPDPGTCTQSASGEWNCSNWGPKWLQIGTEGGFLPTPVVKDPQPVTYITDPTAFWVGNVLDTALGIMPAERADVIVDFSQYAGQTLILYNDAPTAWPALDPRYDYFTGAPDQRDTGGYGQGGTYDAVSKTWIGGDGPKAGYGPNTRTVMQFIVKGGTPAAFDTAPLYAAFKSTPAVGTTPGYDSIFKRSQEPIIVAQAAYQDAYNTFPIPANFPWWGVRSSMLQNTLSFMTIDGQQVSNIRLEPKGIHDEMGASFDPEFGRMSGNLGMEIPNPRTNNANLVIYGYSDIPSEDIKNSPFGNVSVGGTSAATITASAVTTLNDGTQIWNISHNGVDTHPIHFHIFDVQVINRLGWDGKIAMPDANELGWKDTVRISPLEDTIVALRPVAPLLPFGIPNSLRPLNPALPMGSAMGFSSIDWTTGQAYVAPSPYAGGVTNILFDFGWEYVWHCHILSHEEMDMMRSIQLRVTTATPGALASAASSADNGVTLTWNDPTPINYSVPVDTSLAVQANGFGNPANEIGFRIDRATTFTTKKVGKVTTTTYNWDTVSRKVLANHTTYTDTTALPGTTYYYRVVAYNANSNVVNATTGAATSSMNETSSAVVTVVTPSVFLTSPVSGSVFNAGDTIVLNATAGTGITKVTFKNGTATLGTDTTKPFSFSWVNVPAGTYTLTAVGFKGTNTTQYPSPAISITVLAKLAKPATLTVPVPSASPNTNTLSWSAVTGATGYIVEQSTDAFATAGTVVYSGSNTTAPITVYVNGAYSFRVQATASGAASSAWTAGSAVWNVSIPAAAPTSITYPSSSSSGVYTVSWSASLTPGSTYILEESTTSNFAVTTIIGNRSTVTSALIAGRTNGTYYYRVTSVHAGMANSAPFSGANTGCVVSLPAAVPTALIVPAYTTSGSYTVSWTAPVLTGVITYVVEESATANFATSSVVSTGTTTSVAISSKTAGTWFYRVNAIAPGYTISPWTTGANGTAILKATLTSPATGASYLLGNTISMVATGSVSTGYVIGGAQFYDNGILVADDTNPVDGLSASYSTATAGAHNLTAVVYYTNGIDSISAPATVTVTVPVQTITIDQPVATVTDLGTATTVTASPSATNGAVVGLVYFSENGVPIGIAPSAPYSILWTPATAGIRSLTATAYYNNSTPVTSAAKNITINGTVIAPASITVPATSATGIYSVSWAASATAGVTYTLEESTDNFATSTVVTSGLTATSAAITKMLNATYSYRVKAVKAPMADSSWVSGACVVSIPPAAPTLVSPVGTVTTLNPTYTFNAVLNATGYSVRLIAASGSTDTVWYTPVDAGCPGNIGVCSIPQVTPLVNGVNYSWYARAKNAAGIGAWSAYKSFTVSISAAAPPSITVPGSSTGDYTVSWGASTTAGATYLLQESTSSTFSTVTVVTSGLTATSAAITGKINGTFYYRVKAQASGVLDSAWVNGSGIVSIPVPTAVTLIAPSGTVATTNPIYTFNPIAGATAYTVRLIAASGTTNTAWYTSADAGCPGNVGICSIPQITPLVNGVNYSWYARAQNAGGAGPFGAYKNFVIAVNAAVPTSLSVPGSTTGDYTVSWGASTTAGATYVLQESTSSTFSTVTVVTSGLSATSAAITGKINGTYYYRVKAQASGVSDSAWVSGSGVVSIPVPTTVALIAPTGTVVTTTPTYTFNPVAGATGYSVRLIASGGISTDTTWISSAAAGCPGNVGICSITQGTALISGQNYSWYARAQNGGGNGPFGAYKSFTVK